MPGQNLTRLEAQDRRALVSTDSYAVELDLTTGPDVFRSRTVVRFTATEGASTFIDLIARDVREITLNGVAIDPAAAFADSRIALDGLAAENELVVDADCLYTNTGEVCIASSTPSTARCTSTRSSRCPTRAACSRCSSSPT